MTEVVAEAIYRNQGMEFRSTGGNSLKEILEEIQRDQSHPASTSNTISLLLEKHRNSAGESLGKKIAKNDEVSDLSQKLVKLEKTVETLLSQLSDKVDELNRKT